MVYPDTASLVRGSRCSGLHDFYVGRFVTPTAHPCLHRSPSEHGWGGLCVTECLHAVEVLWGQGTMLTDGADLEEQGPVRQARQCNGDRAGSPRVQRGWRADGRAGELALKASGRRCNEQLHACQMIGGNPC